MGCGLGPYQGIHIYIYICRYIDVCMCISPFCRYYPTVNEWGLYPRRGVLSLGLGEYANYRALGPSGLRFSVMEPFLGGPTCQVFPVRGFKRERMNICSKALLISDPT